MFAYCDHVAPSQQAVGAAADAFARLRSEVAAAGEWVCAINVDELLMASTRRAAAARCVDATTPPAGAAQECAEVKAALIAHGEQSPGMPGRERSDAHIAGCASCTAVSRRLEAGQRAFDRPPLAPLPSHVTEQIVNALVAAAPVKALGGDTAAVRAQTWRRLIDIAGDDPSNSSPRSTQPGAAGAVREVGADAAKPSLPELAPTASVGSPGAATPTGASSAFAGTAAVAPAAPDAPPAVASTIAASAQPPRRSGQVGRSARHPDQRPEAATLGALLAETWASIRHGVLGPPPGSVERRRQRPSIGRRGAGSGHRPSVKPPTGTRTELVAVGLFVLVATILALITYSIASEPSSTSSVPAEAREQVVGNSAASDIRQTRQRLRIALPNNPDVIAAGIRSREKNPRPWRIPRPPAVL